MCQLSGSEHCLGIIQLEETTKFIIGGIWIGIHLLLSILSGIAWHQSNVNDDAKVALMYTAITPVFYIIVYFEQGCSCGHPRWWYGFWKLVMTLTVCSYYTGGFILLYRNYHNSSGTSFSQGMIKSDTIIFTITGAPLVVYYLISELTIIFCCMFPLDDCHCPSNSGGSSYQSVNTSRPTYYTSTEYYTPYSNTPCMPYNPTTGLNAY